MSSIIISVTMLMMIAVIASGYVFETFSSTVEEVEEISDTSMLLDQIQKYKEQGYNLQPNIDNQNGVTDNTEDLIKLIGSGT